MYNKILLGIDKSENAQRAAKKVIKLQKLTGADVVAFHAANVHHVPKVMPVTVPMQPAAGYIATDPSFEARRAALKESGRVILGKTTKLFEEHDIPVETRLITDMDPEEYALEAIEKDEFDLVVIGCKGDHSKLERIFLGTTAQKLVNEAGCDVLIVR
ncbi:hypothetical protein GF325_14010 [Candidatus Bathyarchaeota archaeon]|nr:hypothetical protein [Candidatus Bathyarchaeota archaeon]